MIPISALQHYAFCPRQCAYIHLERCWQENYLTARGQQLHQRVHSQEAEQRGATRSERSVQVCSWRLNLTGQLDLLEIRQNPLRFTPVEYKRGKPKVSDCDRVQLCAQALCLEEMTATKIERGAIWYWQVKKREWIALDLQLRVHTEQVIKATSELFAQGQLPAANYSKACRSCSFYQSCQPQLKDHSRSYIQQIFTHAEATQ